MVIGIDIDDTITNHCETWFNAYNKEYVSQTEKKLTLDDAYKWNFYDDWDIEKKQHLMHSLYNTYYFDNLQLLPKVKEVIKSILDSNNEVIIISATSKDFQDKKKQWLLNQIPFLKEEDIIFTKQKERINVNIMIDDNLECAKKFSCPVLLFNRPWNSNRPAYEYSENMIRVGNWDDIKEILIKMNAITIQFEPNGSSFSEETIKLIDGIKNAETDKECIDILNPYIKLWQQQGILIGLNQINDATALVAKEIIKEINAKK